MSFGGFNAQQLQAKSEINVVPLVDVMLVLLVIFIITAPLLTHSVKINLPKASSTPNVTKAENIQLAIGEDASILWNGEEITKDILAKRFSLAAKKEPQPELHISADRVTKYEVLAHVLSTATNEGLTRVGFITEPEAGWNVEN